MDAVRERFDGGGPTTVWMSGGRDSTAVFAAGQQAIRERRVRGPFLPVSRSDPVGDVGREDDVIDEVAAFWGVSPRWVDASAVRMIIPTAERGMASEDSSASKGGAGQMSDRHKTHNGRDQDGNFKVKQADVDDLLEDPRGADFLKDDVRLSGAVEDTGPLAGTLGERIERMRMRIRRWPRQ